MTMKRYSPGSRPRLEKTHDAEAKAEGRTVRALVSCFGNVDLQGDVVRPGAFTKSLARWKESGNQLGFVWSHMWSEPFAHLGVVTHASETDKGLEVVAELDDDTPFVRQVTKLLAQRRITQMSFAYDVCREQRREDGANELIELELLECGPTLLGANPATELLGVKAVMDMAAAEERALRTFPGDDGKSGHTDPEIARLKRMLDQTEYGTPFRGDDVVDRFIAADRIERRLARLEDMDSHE